jgi:uncharacterized protein YneF (UPF0154 family)
MMKNAVQLRMMMMMVGVKNREEQIESERTEQILLAMNQ